MNLKLTDRELLLLSDVMNEKHRNINIEFEGYKEEAGNREEPDPELSDIMLEMQSDLALCQSIIEKINIKANGNH